MLDGNEEEVTTIYERPGGNIVVQCSFTNSEDRKYFCKDGCREKDILVETTGDRVQKDRYSIEFIKGSSTAGSLYVGITQLTKSDSGLYRCGLDISLSLDPIRKFNIIVTDPTTSKPPPAFTTPVPSASTLTSTQSDQQQAETTPSPDVWLYIGVTLAVMVVLLALAVLIYCRKRSSEPKEPRMETEYASVTETNRVYEDIREVGGNTAMELSSAHTYTRSQNTADNSSKLTYSELNFSNRTAGSSNSAIRGDRDNVVYSVPRVEANAVYSTVS
ncbi:hypothetical protein D5F01_LYC07767 [Larimichthys crocea]|uniref:Immunoglobulin V-set domain-containing protein n=2 Tax=Larimichthys crocea TaxID=215358 RepID=A0A6G0IN35_LARCR|nr:hypothetical protein D5F01_LYC07759 [Larimichthys crocea]KAE8292680.1 hypothetical protein D5F01_LYC07767 [Larimichthys crocea]